MPIPGLNEAGCSPLLPVAHRGPARETDGMPILKRSRPSSPPSNLAATLTGHGGPVTAVTFSPDGKVLASSGGGRRRAPDQAHMILWNVADRVQCAAFATDRSLVKAVAFRPDGRLLASGSIDRTVRLWDVTNPAHPAQRATLSHPRPGRRGRGSTWDWGVNAARFSPDGRLLAGGCDKTMSLWDVTDPAHPAQWSALAEQGRPGWSGVVKAVDFSPDGRLVAMGATNGVVFWDITDPARPARIAFAREEDKDLGWWARVFGAQGYPTVRAVAFSPDGRLLATVGGHVRASSGNAGDTGSSSGFVSLWNVSDPSSPVRVGLRTRHSVGTVRGLVNAVAFSPDGRLLASGHGDGTVTLADIRDPAQPVDAPALQFDRAARTGVVRAVALSPDGRLLASGHGDRSVRLWEIG